MNPRPKYEAAQAEKQAQRDAARAGEPMKNATKLISTRIPIELWERLETYIEQNGQTKQWLISRALDVYLKRWSGNVQNPN